ncbi:uncharacterized protein DNG_05861 [Cephalotrichum gorgonifer]|uniref:Secreted protein n=1 Tax=Cephalotrichum gorgonifer TaxID=2041049 RepID=A0AAE8SW35_9PEZI|nr:uncharacterized protein DNG_05861 [Cephalotrichum gorgonifer]
MGHTDVNGGETFSGDVPPAEVPQGVLMGGDFMHELEMFGTPTLMAAVAGKIINKTTTPVEIPGYGTVELGLVNMDESTMVDITESVSSNGTTLDWEAPSGNSTWRIFTFWEHYTNQRSCAAGVNADTFLGNGSWIVDHFSKAGAKRTTDFWDDSILSDDEVAQMLSSVGNYAWEDSMEINAALYWTPDLPQRFKKLSGYNINTYLPVLFSMKNTWLGLFPPYGEVYAYGNKTLDGESIHQLDYRRALNDGYQDYLRHFVEWSHSLGLKYSAQPAYNLPLEMLDDIPLLDAPEGESLAFNDNIDVYRQFVGAAHLSGQNLVSTEVGAVHVAPYSQSVPELLARIRRSLAGGFTMNIIHGATYTGPYPNTTWPGYTTFNYQFTDMWSKRQPGWQHMNSIMDYIGRNQYLLSRGVPKVDLAFYLYAAPWPAQEAYSSPNLQNLGYTYDYLSGENLQSQDAAAEDGVISPNGPGYKALIISGQQTITVEAVEAIIGLSKAGVPIIIVGEAPSQSFPATQENLDAMEAAMSRLLSRPHVHSVDSAEGLPSLLESINVLPRAGLSCSSSVVSSVWRSDGEVDYLFLYNNGNGTADCHLSISLPKGGGRMAPYTMDAWTGSEEPLVNFNIEDNALTVEIDLRGQETSILAFKAESPPLLHVTSAKSGVVALKCSNNEVVAAISGPAVINTSRGPRSFQPELPPATNLTVWNITIEDWHAGEDPSDMSTEVTATEFPSHLLMPWTQFGDSFAAVSGVGLYNTSFVVPKTESDDVVLGGFLRLGPMTNTMRVYMDGAALPPLDPSRPEVDITPWLGSPGQSHELHVVVTSTLFNRVKASTADVITWGVVAAESQPLYESSAAQDHGLIGPVLVEWVALEPLNGLSC